MKKLWKRLSMLALAALTCLTVGISKKEEQASSATSAPSLRERVETLPLSATVSDSDIDVNQTEAVKNYAKADENFHFISGCQINLTPVFNGAEPLSSLRFGVELDNEDLISLEDRDTAYATFTLYRGGDTIKPLYRVMIFHAWNLIGMAHTHISGDGESGISSYQNNVRISPSQEVGDAIIDPKDPDSWVQAVGKTHAFGFERENVEAFVADFRDNNYILDFVAVRGERNHVDQPIIFQEVDGRLQLYFDVTLNSFDAQYFLTFNYEYELYSADIYKSGQLKSDTRSIGQVLTNMQADGSFDEEIQSEELREKALDIIASVQEKKSVTIEYLEQIGDAPFAKKVTANVTVPVLNNSVKKDDAELQIGKTTDCLGSYVTSFTYNESRDVYEGTYGTSMISYIRTASGDQAEIFLDLNLSFSEYYYPFVQAGYIESDAFELMWTKMLAAHNETLSPYSDRRDGVYGLFGYALVPQGYEISDVWASLSAKDTMYKSAWPMYTHNTKLNTSGYSDLLGDYHQAWYRKAWNVMQSWFGKSNTNAKHIFFYGDALDDAVISGTGSTDINNTNSLLMNNGKDAAIQMAETLTAAAKDAINGIKNSNPFQKVKRFFTGLAYALATVLVVWIALKLFPTMKKAVVGAFGSGSKSSHQRRDKKKKKK